MHQIFTRIIEDEENLCFSLRFGSATVVDWLEHSTAASLQSVGDGFDSHSGLVVVCFYLLFFKVGVVILYCGVFYYFRCIYRGSIVIYWTWFVYPINKQKRFKNYKCYWFNRTLFFKDFSRKIVLFHFILYCVLKN